MTAVRRFLARLEKQTAVRALIFAGLLALIAAVAIFGIYGPGYDAQQFIYFQF